MIKDERLPGQVQTEANVHVCNLCGKKFFTEKTLFEHLKAHNPEDAFDPDTTEDESLVVAQEPKRRTRRARSVKHDPSTDISNDKDTD